MKKTLTTITLAFALLIGTTFANAGIIIAGSASPGSQTPCTETDNTGIIIAGVGIIIAGLTNTGIIIAGNTDQCPQADNTGIIIAG